jgi:Flp pilus assembly protein protease CpaA
MSSSLNSYLPLIFLLIAVIDDLCFKKFHNWLFLTLTFIGFSYAIFLNPISPLQAFGGFVAGGLLMLPLVLMGATGAGDMKFMMSFGTLLGTTTVFEVFVYALFWGALIGLFQTLFAGNLKLLFQNLKLLYYKVKPVNTNQIPYTVAILFAWATYFEFGGLL